MKARGFIVLFLSLCVLGISPVFNVSAHAQGISQNFSRDLTIGSAGADVASLQAFLIAQGFLQTSGPTGIFDTTTAKAVARWQTSVGLTASGYFGALSRAAIQKNVAVTKTSTVIAVPKPAPAPPASTYSRNLAVGSVGADVIALQSFLITKGFLAITKPTGVFGQLTAGALAKWQSSASLSATGYFGALSRANIGIAAPQNIALNKSVTTPVAPSIPAPISPTTPVAPIPTTTHITAYINSGGGGGGGGIPTPAPAPTPTPPDITPPIISLTNPSDGTITSSTITVTATASDDVGVASVQFTLDGAHLGSPVTVAPYQVFLDSLSIATGTHELSAIASDAAGNTASAGNITITVIHAPVDTTPPIVSITSPTASSTVTGNILIVINASDDTAVTKVEFYIDNVLQASSTSSAPYIFPLNTQSLSVGSHTLTAKAYDAAGNVGTTPGTNMAVIAPAPSIPNGLTITSNTSSSLSLSWSPATEAGGAVVGYQVYRGGIQVATTTLTTFRDTGLASSTNYTYSISSFDAGAVFSATSTSVTTTTLAVLPSLNYNFGLSVGENPVYMSSAALNQEFNTMESLGVGWIRFDMQWEHVQPDNSSSYNWSLIDPVVAAATAHHIKVLPILDFTPVWAASSSCTGGNSHCAPADPNAFATFAAAAVARYAPEGVSAWEIWNEPNNTVFWGPTSNCAAYTGLLKAAYPAIKAVDPSATVITAGLSPAATDGYNMSPPDFLSCIYANGGKNYFDAVGDHPYTFPYLPSDNPGGAWDQMANGAGSLRGIMVANGDSAKQIWITEFGAPTNGPDSNWYVSESQQSAMMTDAYNLFSSYSWAGPFFWYTYQDSGISTSTSENFFGLLRYDGSTKPAYTTLENIIAPTL